MLERNRLVCAVQLPTSGYNQHRQDDLDLLQLTQSEPVPASTLRLHGNFSLTVASDERAKRGACFRAFFSAKLLSAVLVAFVYHATPSTAETIVDVLDRASEGDTASQIELAEMLRLGRGAKKDEAEAVRWYRAAAVTGNADAQAMLAAMHYSGRGTPQDHFRSYVWSSLAAANGSELGRKLRDIVSSSLTQSSLERAQAVASECFARDYSKCE